MEFAKRFPFDGQPIPVYSQSDDAGRVTDVVRKGQFTSKLTGKKATLGICSFGDNRSMLEDYFLPFVIDDHCDVIVVACHNFANTDGNTYNFIDKIAIDNNYRLISTSILYDNNDRWGNDSLVLHHINAVNINEIFADNMIKLIKSIV